MMSMRARTLLILPLAALALGVVTFVVFATGGEADPRFPQTPPDEVTSEHGEHQLEDLQFGRLEAVGFSNAEVRLADAAEYSPFPLRLPEYVPAGLKLEHFNLLSFETNQASFDAVYTVAPTGGWRPAVHIWQSNRPYESDGPIQGGDQAGSLEVNGQTWDYWLLTYPQVDDSVREVWDAHTTMADGIFVTVDLRIGENPKELDREGALSDLTKVLESLTATTP